MLRRLASAAAAVSITAAVCLAQGIVSSRSGLVHYIEGNVTIDGLTVESKVGKFSDLKENSVLKTGQGRAEILLTPGVYLRVGENTTIKMLDNRLLSTRVEFLGGSAIVESDDPEVSVKDPAVTIVYKDYQVQPLKYGIFEITSDPSVMKVYKGQANVLGGTEKSVIREGRELIFSAALLTERFNEKDVDDLYLWARDRSGSLSAANLASARSLSQGGYSLNNLYMGGTYPGLGFNSGLTGGWYFNQRLGMYAYLPYDGLFYSPWGYGIFSPGMIYSYYTPGGYTWSGGGGARTATFVPQPVTGTVGTFRSGNGSSAPGRLSGNLPVAGSNSGTVSSARGGFTSGLARPVTSSPVSGGRFGGTSTASSNNGAGVFSTASSAASNSGAFSGGSIGGGSIGGGGASAGGGIGAARGGGGGAPASGGRAR
jgi:hypothetical protein